MWTDEEFIDVLEAHLAPLLYSFDPYGAAAARQTCSSWRAAFRASLCESVRVNFWEHRDISSFSMWLVKAAGGIKSLHLSTEEQELHVGKDEANALRGLAESLPLSLQMLELTNGVALPLMVKHASRLPHLRSLTLRNLPGKWTYLHGMFPWDDENENTIFDGKQIGVRMYGSATFERFSPYWISFEKSLVCLAQYAQNIQILDLEAPARATALGIVTSLAQGAQTPRIRELCLRGFGANGSNPAVDETVAGLDISSLSSLAHSLTRLELERCGISPCHPSTLKSLGGLQVLSLFRSTLLTSGRPVQLYNLSHLRVLNLKHSDWFNAEREPWDLDESLILPSSIQEIDLIGFDSLPATTLSAGCQITRLCILAPASLSPSPRKCEQIYSEIQVITTGFKGLKSFGKAASALTSLTSLTLFDCPPKKLCKYGSSLCPHLTHLAFSGELNDKEEVSCNTDQGDIWDKGLDDTFTRLGQNLSLLAELHLTVGIEGYDSMDLSRLHVLSKLLIDNCEFVQLDRTILPKQLKTLSLLAWYGLKEHYVLAEQVQYFSTFKVDRIKCYEDQSKVALERVLESLPELVELVLNWDVLVQSKAVLHLQRLKQLSMMWVKDSLGEEHLMALDNACPDWRCVRLANCNVMAEKRVQQLDALKKQIRDSTILLEHKESSKLVDLKEIPTLVRNLGVNPTGAQANMIIDQLATLNADSTLIPLEHVETVVSNFLSTQEAYLVRDDYHTLIRAFRAFDTEGKGYCFAEQLKTALQSKGEPLTDDELNRMIGFAADENGKLFYEDYCQKLATDGRSI